MGGVVVRDLFTGEVRAVTNRPDAGLLKGWTEDALISPDAKRVAFLWGESDPMHKKDRYQVRIVDATGANERVLLEAPWTNNITDWVYYEVAAWSPDGVSIVVEEYRGRRPNRLLLLSTGTAPNRVLFQFPQQHHRFSRIQFSAEGRWLAFDTAGPGASDSGVFTLDLQKSSPPLVEVAPNSRMAGWLPAGRGLLVTKLHDTRRELFIQPVSEGRAAGGPSKVEATPEYTGWTLHVTEAGRMIFEDMKRTAEAEIVELTSTPAMAGSTLTRQPLGGWNALHALYSPDGQRALFALAYNRILIRSLLTGAESTLTPQLADYSHIEWAAGGESLFMAGRGKNGVPGIYRVDPSSGASSLLVKRPIRVFAPARDGKTLLCHDDEGFQSLDLRTGTITPLQWPKPGQSVSSLRFSHDGKRVAVFGEGTVMVIDTVTGSGKTLISSPWHHYRGDWSPDDRYLYWPWGTGMRSSQLIRMPAEGGEPLRMDLKGNYSSVEVSADGRQLLLVKRSQNPQVWAMENFLPSKE
jgi:Tol biopolymer transport system component